MAIINEVVTKFSFAGDLKPQENFNKNLNSSIKLLAGFGVATVAAAGAFAGWVNSTLSSIDPMIQLSRETGVAIEAIQELSYAASVSGSNAQALQSSIAGLSQTIGKAAQFGSEEFSRLGISVRDANGQVKTADVILRELSSSFKRLGLSMQEQQSFAQSLGIDPSLIQLLGRTGSEMDSLREKAKNLGVITQEQADATADYNDSITTLKFGFNGLQNIIAVGFAPELKALTEKFITFLEVNKDTIQNGITKFGEAVGVLVNSIVRLTPVILGVGAAFTAWKIASLGLATVLGTIFSPVYLITAAIAAAILFVDDLIVAFQGGESVIANFFESAFGIDIRSYLQDIIDGFSKLMDVAKNVLNYIGDIFAGTFDIIKNTFKLFTDDISFGEWINETTTNFQGLLDPIKTVFDSIMTYIQPIIDGIKIITDFEMPSLSDIGSNISNATSSVLDNVLGSFIFGDNETVQTTIPAGQAIGATKTSSQVNNLDQNISINIATSDPVRAGTAVQDSLQNQMQDAQTQFKRGGR